MKRPFLILLLFLAINFTNPGVQVFSQNSKNKIEFVREVKNKDFTKNELFKNKVILYLRYQVLLQRIAVINSKLDFNSS